MREYTAYVGETHRKRFGQFFTPPDVARWMIAWVLRGLEKGSVEAEAREKARAGAVESDVWGKAKAGAVESDVWEKAKVGALEAEAGAIFDPAFGMGAFYAQTPSGVRFSGCEIDPVVLEFWEATHQREASFVQRQDYLFSWGQKHRHIVCNPPYARFQHVAERHRIHAAFAEHTGLRLAGHTNLASAFLLKSLSELEGGRMAYLMPLEFLNTGYGRLVKERLCLSGHLYAILRLDCEKDLFPDVTTSVGILLFDAGALHTSVRFGVIARREDLQGEAFGGGAKASVLEAVDAQESDVLARSAKSWVKEIPLASLDPEDKWLSLFRAQTPVFDLRQMVKLSVYGRFQRGIATGANAFFTLRPSRVAALGLDPQKECVACVTKSAQVKRLVFRERDYAALWEADQPVLLLSLSAELSEAAEHYVSVGEAQELDHRFLTKHRTPWYKMEQRKIAPLWLSVFSRGGYKVILNKSHALHLTCFHGFQPNACGEKLVDALFLYLSSQTGRAIMALSMRNYGAALDKFEPNDLNQAMVPPLVFWALFGDAQIAQAVEETASTGRVPAWLEVALKGLVCG